MTRTLRTLDSLLSRIESIMMVVFTFIGLAIGALQVVLRYLFNTGVHWSMPVFVLFTVFGMLMAGSRAVRATGRRESFDTVAAVETQLEVELLKEGGVIPHILKKMIATARLGQNS